LALRWVLARCPSAPDPLLVRSRPKQHRMSTEAAPDEKRRKTNRRCSIVTPTFLAVAALRDSSVSL
jgi:hypothetical protein